MREFMGRYGQELAAAFPDREKFQAAVEAGLTIPDRTPHSKEVSYASYGEDATVYWSSGRKIDLAFKNDTDHNIYVVAAVETDPSNKKRLVATTTIYGEDLGNIRYELQSSVVRLRLPPNRSTSRTRTRPM